ncbi:MAG: aldo/keto reductase [Calditrichaeota bacterium]|nr:MAG: aldo/keto reductase [Calditrichota bacterium]
MSIPGYATPEATRQFAEAFAARYPTEAYRSLGRTHLRVSKIGFGTYRCHHQIEVHQQALKAALARGCNIIDTSANYTDGGAEILIGDVLNQEIVWGERRREELVIVSKAGYIQGENLKIAEEREQQGNPFPEVVKYQPGLWHCLHPEFLEDQLTRSLSRMHLDTLDVYLLHNPEYFLSHAHRTGSGNREETEREFYDRIRRAFIQMEKFVAGGLIRYYGISSNGFPLEEDATEFVSLGRVWKAYTDACLDRGITPEEGHFAVIQLPFNWLETGAATRKNHAHQGQSFTVLELARHLGLGVLINRPLNAIREERLVRLARYGSQSPEDARKTFQLLVEGLLQTEREYSRRVWEWGRDVQVGDRSLADCFTNALPLRQLTEQPYDISYIRGMLPAYFSRPLQKGMEELAKRVPESEREEARKFAHRYGQQFNETVTALLEYLNARNYAEVQHLEARFDQAYPHRAGQLTFSQKALTVAANTPGVDVALNGMRTPEYVEDSLKVMEVEDPVSPELL